MRSNTETDDRWSFKRIMRLPFEIRQIKKLGLDNPVFAWWRSEGHEGLPEHLLGKDMPPLSAPVTDAEILVAAHLVKDIVLGVEWGFYDKESLKSGRIKWSKKLIGFYWLVGILTLASAGLLLYMAWLTPDPMAEMLYPCLGFLLLLPVLAGPSVYLSVRSPWSVGLCGALMGVIFFLWNFFKVSSLVDRFVTSLNLPPLTAISIIILLVLYSIGATIFSLGAANAALLRPIHRLRESL